MFGAFVQSMGLNDAGLTIVDVGVTSDQIYDGSNYLEAWYCRASQITAVGIGDASFLIGRYPGVRFVQADGCRLPFKDKSFDITHSSAVLEHVGIRSNQVEFLSELSRVARRGLFVTTPNRWFPVEFHTVLPLLHWLPMRTYRKLLAAIGKEFFASEENLNLLSRSNLAAAAKAAGIAEFEVTSVSLFGWPSNLLLISRKRTVG
jgi:ubiquinone/menaquinone biosynthesis C-methylase UbiE